MPPAFVIMNIRLSIVFFIILSLFNFCFSHQSNAMSPNESILDCQLNVEAVRKQAVILKLTLVNTTLQTLFVDKALTPFEGWRSRFIELEKDGQALPYQGVTIKRAASKFPRDFLHLEPKKPHTQNIDLASVYSVKEKGEYIAHYIGAFGVKSAESAETELYFPDCYPAAFKIE